MKQEIAGQPLWLWLTAAGVIVAGYLYFKHTQSSTAGAPPAPAGKSSSTSSFKEHIIQHDASSTTHKGKGGKKTAGQ